jgi:ATPase subunit of ABC transporter with duplicated ATPase domains
VVKQVRAALSRFNFCGGEQNKSFSTFLVENVTLRMTLKEEGNVLLLEPTNDLDVSHFVHEEGLENSLWLCRGYFSRQMDLGQNLYT